MNRVTSKHFETATFLATAGPGTSILRHTAKQPIFNQGGLADAVFYLQNGHAKLTVVSKEERKQRSRCLL